MESADMDRVEEHLAHVVDVVLSVQARVPDHDAYALLQRDPFALDGLVHRLQTAIQAMIDVAFQLSAKVFKQAPENAVQAFEILKREGVIPPEQMPDLRRMARFRNLVVHGYLRRDFHRMDHERIETGRPKPHTRGRAGHR